GWAKLEIALAQHLRKYQIKEEVREKEIKRKLQNKDKQRVMISYRGTAEELEEEFEGKINYLGQSSSIDSIKFPLEEKEI
ncbi:16240_t:CDS:2, partial [Funneliformis geosporum]